MELNNKIAVVYGGGGALGSTAAEAFAAAGARVYLAGRTESKLAAVAERIRQAGGFAATAVVDALDTSAVDKHLSEVISREGKVDISFNAIGVYHVQGIPLAELTPEEFELPVVTYARGNFITSTAAARVMSPRRAGVLFTLTTPGSKMPTSVSGGFSVSNATVESLSIQLAGELAPQGIRVICLRPDAIPETTRMGSHAKEVFGFRAKLMGKTLDELFTEKPPGGRHSSLEDVGNAAVFFASEKAGAITGVVVNLSCGSVLG
ncbi:SDR family NAD(P)-dependent oxidoreductase [Chitinophaga barathri]|uniref:SDR family oxidoreductase n=1 Tax=Chitinophaga barathri TaxID=1647451 RepID=A0A3N4MHN2_9BACT|nr:SDR family oxidoreductase [Chitinophaga barathri]RPD39149.1 SDR family oxidoreductase [Chitinophaga barathri]